MRELRFFPFLILAVILFNYSDLYSQNYARIDSLRTAILSEKDSQIITNNYLFIADEYSHYNVDSLFINLDLAIKLAKKIDYKTGLARAYFVQSYFYDNLGNQEEAILSMEKAMELLVKLNDSNHLAACYNNLGVLYSYQLNKKKSIEYFIKAVRLNQEFEDSFALAESYSNIGGSYQDLELYTLALKYTQKAHKIDLNLGKPENIAASALELSYINTKLMRYNDALDNLKKAKSLIDDIEKPYYKVIFFQRLASYFNEMAEPDSAQAYITQAEKISQTLNYPMLRVESLHINGELLLKQKKYKESIVFLNRAYKGYIDLNLMNGLPELYKTKASALSGMGKHNEAYKFLQLANRSKAELRLNEVAAVLNEFEKEQTLREERKRVKMEEELEQQKHENEVIRIRSKLYTMLFLSGLLAITLVLALLLYFLKQKHNKALSSNYRVINNQKKLIEKNYEELKQNEKRLQELNATKDKFFSIIAHDLKNPFHTLIGISELILNDPGIKNTEDFNELMQGMLQTAMSGHELLENLLEWSRSQVGGIKNYPESIVLADIFSSIALFFHESAKAKEIEISFPYKNEQKIFADYNMVNFIMRNIVNNAIKFSHLGGKIEVSTYPGKEMTLISVKDEGVGIKHSLVDKLFKIEHSTQQKGTANEKGTGLGLILCKEFVEKNGGEIWVESVEGKGSTFTFSLPNSPEEKELKYGISR